MEEGFFDRTMEIYETRGGNLPHWHQFEKLQFITFRLADSIPQEAISKIREANTRFCNQYPRPWSPEVQKKYSISIGRFENLILDQGYGDCILAQPPCRKIVEESIMHNNGITHYLYAYVIMPNHVHILLRLIGTSTLQQVIKGIKGTSSYYIHKNLGFKPPIWQKEYFDRIIRNPYHLYHTVNYIIKNPQNLNSNQYTLYLDPSFR